MSSCVRRNEIAAHAERLRTILDTNPDVHLVLDPVRDESGAIIDFRYEEINNAGVAYTGSTEERAHRQAAVGGAA